MDSEVLIEARGLTRRYGPTVAVETLDLTLRKGEILGLLGPNGAGKSTTMKMLTGNLAPSDGEQFITAFPVAVGENRLGAALTAPSPAKAVAPAPAPGRAAVPAG